MTDCLRAVGRFCRQAMRVVSFPLGLPLGALANGPIEKSFSCENPDEPCGVFIDWWTHFAALLAQADFVRWLISRGGA